MVTADDPRESRAASRPVGVPHASEAWPAAQVPTASSVTAPSRIDRILQHGAGWVAALAAIASVLVTVLVSTRDGAPPATPPVVVATPVSGQASQGPGTTGSGGPTRPPRTDDLPLVTTNAGLVDILRRHELPQSEPYAGYRLVRSDFDDIALEAPTAWDDGVVGVPWLGDTDDDKIGVVALATPNERGLFTTFDTPGVFFAGSDRPLMTGMTADDVLDDQSGLWRSCTFQGRGEYRNEGYAGRYEVLAPCGANQIVILLLAAHSVDGSKLIWVELRLTTEADFPAALRVLDTLSYTPERKLPGNELP